jgi:hypothetical protein
MARILQGSRRRSYTFFAIFAGAKIFGSSTFLMGGHET